MFEAFFHPPLLLLNVPGTPVENQCKIQYVMEPTLVKVSADSWSFAKLVVMPESDYLINGGSLFPPFLAIYPISI